MKDEDYKVLITSIKASIELEKEMMYHVLRLWGLTLGLTRKLTSEEGNFAEELLTGANKELYAQMKITTDLIYSHFYPELTWEQSKEIDALGEENRRDKDIFNKRWEGLYDEFLKNQEENR